MIIESIRIRNYHSILDEVLYCESLTALVGANGAGKSSFLRGLELFYSQTPKIEPEDWYDDDIGVELVITVTFNQLSDDAKQLFENYIQNESLTVERVFTFDGAKATSKYYGASLKNPDFQPIRDAFEIKDRGKTAKSEYEKIVAQSKYCSLPIWSNTDSVKMSLKEWESQYPEDCIRQRDDGQFFGFKEVAQGYLGRFTRFLFIPAVRDIGSDSAEGRGSVLTELMDLVIRSSLANDENLKKFKEDTQRRYDEILGAGKLQELNTLSTQMTETLRNCLKSNSGQ